MIKTTIHFSTWLQQSAEETTLHLLVNGFDVNRPRIDADMVGEGADASRVITFHIDYDRATITYVQAR